MVSSSVPSPEDALSARQRLVLALVSHGLSDAEIADLLHIARSSVRSRVRASVKGLGAHSRAQAAALATAFGLVDPLVFPSLVPANDELHSEAELLAAWPEPTGAKTEGLNGVDEGPEPTPSPP